MTDRDIYPILLGIRDDIGDMKGTLGYVRGKMDAVCTTQDDHSRRIVELERRAHPSMPTTRARPVPVAPMPYVGSVDMRRVGYAVAGAVALVLTVIGSIKATGVL